MGAYATARRPGGIERAAGQGERDQLFFGYYLSLATMVRDEEGAKLAK